MAIFQLTRPPGHCVTERLAISGGRLQGLFVPILLASRWGVPSDRHHLLRVETAVRRISHFGICGGASALDCYQEWKRSLVVDALAQAGFDAPVDALIDAHGDGRRRATFHARLNARDILEVGFAALRAHHIVGIDRCPVLAPSLDGAIPAAWAIAEALKAQNKPLDIQVTATDAGIDIDVRGSGALNSARTGALARLAATHKLARLTRHGELIAQRATPSVVIGRAQVTLPPGSFLQATVAGEQAWRGWCEATSATPRSSPICSAASDRSHFASRSKPGSSPSTPTRAPSQRSSRRPT